MLHLLDESSFLESAVGRPPWAPNHLWQLVMLPPPIYFLDFRVPKYADTSFASIDLLQFSVVYLAPSARVLFPFKP